MPWFVDINKEIKISMYSKILLIFHKATFTVPTLKNRQWLNETSVQLRRTELHKMTHLKLAFLGSGLKGIGIETSLEFFAPTWMIQARKLLRFHKS